MAKQVGALPIRRDCNGNLEVLLVTSRETRRWVIPKGWPWADRADHLAAAEEAHEEAGVLGRACHQQLGTYRYIKRKASEDIPVRVCVYMLSVTKELETWRERKQRTRQWFPLEEAVTKVVEPGLRRIMRKLASDKLRHQRLREREPAAPGASGKPVPSSRAR